MRENAKQNNPEYGHFSRSVPFAETWKDCNSGSSHPEVFCKKGVLRKGAFAKFRGKHLLQSLFFNKAY